MFMDVFWGHQYQSLCRETICKIVIRPQSYPLGHNTLATNIKFPVLVMNVVIDVNHKSGMQITSDASQPLKRLMYFPQARLPSQQSASLFQCFLLSVFYLDFYWLVSQHPRFQFFFLICSCVFSFLFPVIWIYIFIYALV